MAINSVKLNSAVPNTSSITPTDAETKNIQNQITSKNQSLNRLSSDPEMSAEEKAKERQEIQKQIAELNRKLRMLRMEKKEEAEEAKKEQAEKAALIEEQTKELSGKDSDKTTSSETAKEETFREKMDKIEIPPQNIQKLLEAGTLLQKERIQQSAAREKDATINILEAEIKSDELYGADTSDKREKLSSMIKQKSVEIKEPQQPQKLSDKNTQMKIVIREDEIIT